MNNLFIIAQIVQSIALSIGVIIGGFWGYYRFFRESRTITSLVIHATYTIITEYLNSDKLVHINLALENLSEVGQAYPLKEGLINKEKKIILSRGVYNLTYSYELQIRKIPVGAASFRWFDCPFDEIHNEPINVLLGRKRFSLRPLETVHEDIYVRLRKGNYIGIATFITTETGKTIFKTIFNISVM